MRYTTLMDDTREVYVALPCDERHQCERRVPLKEDACGVYCPICGEGVQCPTSRCILADNLVPGTDGGAILPET